MKTINIYKALPCTRNGAEIEPLTINIHKALPEAEYKDLDAWRELATDQAKTLCTALTSTLPQGVVDALLVCLLDHKRSLFVVATPAPDPAPDPALALKLLRTALTIESEGAKK